MQNCGGALSSFNVRWVPGVLREQLRRVGLMKPVVSAGVRVSVAPLHQPSANADHMRILREKFLQPGKVHDTDFLYFCDLSSEAVFLDVGANIGLSINSLMSVGCHAHVHAFEPNWQLWAVLLDVVKTYQGAAALHFYGLSDADCSLQLHVPYVNDRPIPGEASVDREHFNDPIVRRRLMSYGDSLRFEAVSCRLKRLDDLGLRPTHIKIDVEGHELAALKGMQRTLGEHRPLLLIEAGWHPPIMQFLSGFGYRAMTYQPATGALVPLGAARPLNVFFTH
jgi:FkbM family methyltransferase